MKIYQSIARKIEAIQNCVNSGNKEFECKHTDAIFALVKDTAPSGSGIDAGTKFDLGSSTSDKLVFQSRFHHMDDNGMYDGWTDHTIKVTPCLAHGFSLKISGANRNEIKTYLHEVYASWLNQETEI